MVLCDLVPLNCRYIFINVLAIVLCLMVSSTCLELKTYRKKQKEQTINISKFKEVDSWWTNIVLFHYYRSQKISTSSTNKD